MEDILSGLNEEQKEAVTTTEGFIRIIAGAGYGKTKALTHRYAYLVNELGILMLYNKNCHPTLKDFDI